MLNIISHQGNTMRHPFIPLRRLEFKKWKVINVGKDVEKLEHSYTADRYEKCCSHCGKQAVLQKVKDRVTI